MKTGDLRRRVTLQQLQQTDDGMGGFQTAWVDVATVWANIDPYLSKRSIDEKWVAEQLEDSSFYTVTIRYRTGVDASMQLKYGNHLYNIRSITDEGLKHIYLVMLCEELQTVPT